MQTIVHLGQRWLVYDAEGLAWAQRERAPGERIEYRALERPGALPADVLFIAVPPPPPVLALSPPPRRNWTGRLVGALQSLTRALGA